MKRPLHSHVKLKSRVLEKHCFTKEIKEGIKVNVFSNPMTGNHN